MKASKSHRMISMEKWWVPFITLYKVQLEKLAWIIVLYKLSTCNILKHQFLTFTTKAILSILSWNWQFWYIQVWKKFNNISQLLVKAKEFSKNDTKLGQLCRSETRVIEWLSIANNIRYSTFTEKYLFLWHSKQYLQFSCIYRWKR